MKRFKLFTAALSLALACSAAAPANYYNSCENKNGRNLLAALNGVIANHTTLSYKSLNTYYPKTDAYPDGTLWDIYSTKHWNPSQKCGNYSSVGDCYNKEHSFPKSWFDDASPMYSDLHHLYPTDGKVNGQRSNHPYGECANGKTLAGSGSVKALGRLGSSTFSGYSGTVFEPDDEYKGDLARTYFYMAACYYTRTASWHSDMLAGNNFPLFKPWAINLLLKWHRQDPVSQRELTRNDAVYNVQHNRNPFIDHPELAEYIWGNKTDELWTASGLAETTINQPVDGADISLGVTGVNVAVSKKLPVRTTGAQSTVTLTATAPFSVSPATIPAATANNGSEVTVTYRPLAAGEHTGSLTVTAGDVKHIVSLSGETVDGLPVSAATNVTEESFVANWVYVGDADATGCYSLSVADDAGILPGYPKKVNAAAGSYTVTGLMPFTDYSYSIASQTMVSDYIFVRTAEAMPMIEFLFDGDLFFSTTPGTPSDYAELLVASQNIETDIEVSIKAPFELSLDLSNWSNKITMSSDESRIYLRVNSEEQGTFESSIVTRAGTYYNDNTVVSATVSDTPSFIEDFEATGKYDTYNPQTYMGSAAVWNLNRAGIWTSDSPYDGKQSLRAGSKGGALIEMAEPRKGGCGTVRFYAQRWTAKEPLPVIAIETSVDNGTTWQSHGSVEIESADWKEYTVTPSVPGNVRLRLRQTDGERFMIDNISITDRSTGIDDPYAHRHMWAAYSINGMLTVDVTANDGIEAAIYAVDGTTVFAGRLAAGQHQFALTPGTVVIVHSGDFSRTVLIR